MNSPVNALLKQFIQFEKNSSTPIYIQISHQIIDAIQRGYLTKGTALPGSRTLSQLLRIHRNTIVAVYDELASQGWVEIIPNKGTFILVPEQKTAKIKAISYPINQSKEYTKTTGFEFKPSFHLASFPENIRPKFVLNDGQPDLRLHPVHQFSKWYSTSMKRKNMLTKWSQTDLSSHSVYENQLCNYLNATRGFHIKPENLISTRSTEMSLYIVSQLLLQPNDVVLVGNLSNYAANMIFQQVGAKIKTIPTDENGLDVDFIKKNFAKKNIRCVYVCANRHYPTTYSLSAERRLELLKLAKEYEFAIIEDDYDYDFQYEGSAMIPMASSDSGGNVIYLGKLGQSLFPSFQTGFVVAPYNLIIEAKNYLKMIDRQGDIIQEQVLAELIHEGEIHRLIKKNIIQYKLRRDFLGEMLSKYFKNDIKWTKPSGGLAIWLEFSSKISLVQLAKETLKNDLLLPNTILYQDRATCAIRLGYGHLNEEEMEIVVKKLKTAYDIIVKK